MKCFTKPYWNTLVPIAAGDISSISGSEGDSSSEEEEDRNTSKLKEKLPVSKLWLLEKRKLESSDSESEMSAHVEGIGRRHPRVFLHNNKGQLLSIYRCVLHGRKVSKISEKLYILL